MALTDLFNGMKAGRDMYFDTEDRANKLRLQRLANMGAEQAYADEMYLKPNELAAKMSGYDANKALYDFQQSKRKLGLEDLNSNRDKILKINSLRRDKQLGNLNYDIGELGIKQAVQDKTGGTQIETGVIKAGTDYSNAKIKDNEAANNLTYSNEMANFIYTNPELASEKARMDAMSALGASRLGNATTNQSLANIEIKQEIDKINASSFGETPQQRMERLTDIANTGTPAQKAAAGRIYAALSTNKSKQKTDYKAIEEKNNNIAAEILANPLALAKRQWGIEPIFVGKHSNGQSLFQVGETTMTLPQMQEKLAAQSEASANYYDMLGARNKAYGDAGYTAPEYTLPIGQDAVSQIMRNSGVTSTKDGYVITEENGKNRLLTPNEWGKVFETGISMLPEQAKRHYAAQYELLKAQMSGAQKEQSIPLAAQHGW